MNNLPIIVDCNIVLYTTFNHPIMKPSSQKTATKITQMKRSTVATTSKEENATHMSDTKVELD